MSRPAQSLEEILTAVSTARAHALSALEGVSADRSAAEAAIVPLQAAANQLGKAEGVLARAAGAAPDAPAPLADPDEPRTRGDELAMTGEAVAVMALAESSVPYAASPAAEVDHWLRVLRREGSGKVGRALGELGFPDGQLVARAELAASPGATRSIAAVRATAIELARRRRAAAVTTIDILFAIFVRYGSAAARALYERGISRQVLLDQIADADHAALPAVPRT